MRESWRVWVLLISLVGLAGGAVPAREPSQRRIEFEGTPVRIAGGTSTHGKALGIVVARPSGAFAIAFSKGGALAVRTFAASGDVEEVAQLGSLGYSNSFNIKSLAALGSHNYGVTWEYDASYHIGVTRSYVSFVGPGLRRTVPDSDPDRLFNPVGDTDGEGGFFTVVWDLASGGIVFRHWSATGELLRSGPVNVAGYPLQAMAFRGGLAVLVWRPGDPSSIAWINRNGGLVEEAEAAGSGLVTNRSDLVVDLSALPNLVAARFGPRPRQLRPAKVLAQPTSPWGSEGASLAIDADGTSLLAWTDADGFQLRAFNRLGLPLSPAVTGPFGHRPRLSEIGPGRFLLVWHDATAVPAGVRATIWAQRVSVVD